MTWCLLGLLAVAAPVAAENVQTTVRMFELQHASVREVSLALQPMLSEYGSLTVQPRSARITVQDRPEVIAKIADMVASLDHPRSAFRIRVDLVEGSMSAPPSADEVTVDSGVRQMFRFAHYRRLGMTTIEGDLGQPVVAEIGENFRLSFLPEAFAENQPWGIPNREGRLSIQQLTLIHLDRRSDAGAGSTEVLRTNVILSPGQHAVVAASTSETAERGLVLMLYALRTVPPTKGVGR
jgi:hypothetical protein